MRTNVEAVAQTLRALPVDMLFGLMGNGNLDLIAEMAGRHDCRYIAVRHENAAVAAADGYARAGKEPAIATVTHGPGLTNALTALVTAHRARSPLLLIAGNASGYPGRSTQRLDHRSAVEALGIPVVSPSPADDWAAATRHAARMTAKGPVLLDFPAEAMRSPYGSSARLETPTGDVPRAPDCGDVGQAATWLRNGERPLIIAGRGAVRTGIGPELVELARRTGAGLGTTLAAKGLFSGVASDIGIV
ncbi:MAG: thiamine pyrophosphate-binding protein, partial [Candidatus Acidiferrales bacterium]